MAAHVAEMTVTIPNGTAATPAFLVGPFRSGTVQMPAAMTQINFTVQFSNDGVTWTEALELAPETNPITHAASATVLLPSSLFKAKFGRFLAPGNEAAARDFKLFLKD